MPKNRIIVFVLTLMLCIGVFHMHSFAAAESDTTPPRIFVEDANPLLRITASDEGLGVEAIFINENRINYRVDGVLEVILEDYAGTDVYIPVYAIDFAGNRSETVQIENPYYIEPDPTPQEIEIPEPEPSEVEMIPPVIPTEEIPFTPDGVADVVDNATGNDGKEFFTFFTPEGNEFYLVIDRQRGTENIYLLNKVTEEDLTALTGQTRTGDQNTSLIPEPTPEPTPIPEPEPSKEPEPDPPAQKSNSGTILFVLLATVGIGGAAYYFKIVKPKKQQNFMPDDDDEMDDDSDYEEDYPDEFETNSFADDDDSEVDDEV